MRRTRLPDGSLDTTDRAILNALQVGFPLTPRPFADAGEGLGVAEGDLIVRLTRLREIGAITRFGPFYDAEAMGGASLPALLPVIAGNLLGGSVLVALTYHVIYRRGPAAP